MATAEVQAFVNQPPGEAPVRGFLHAAPDPTGLVVLTHGASGNCNAPLLVALAELFARSGLSVLRCDLPYRQRRPHGPPSPSDAKIDQAGLRRAVSVLREQVPGRAFLGGTSYGGRQASMLVASDPSLAEGLLLLSYPLHPPGRASQLRTAHFPTLRTPSLFVSGTRDAFGSIEELEHAIKLIPARTELVPVEGAAHGLTTKPSRSEVPKLVVESFRSFFLQE